jgi:cytochrome c553
MRSTFSTAVSTITFLAAALFAGTASGEADFLDDLALVDEALKTNPRGVIQQSVSSCSKQRGYAIKLHEMGMDARAKRALEYCFESLRISRVPAKVKVTAPTQEALQAKAVKEIEQALSLTPDISNGLKIYRECAACHKPEGSGLVSGSVPQIAGQHLKVVIKQLADIRAGNRDSTLMAPYASAESIGGPQAIADVAAYVDSLEISIANGKGTGDDLALGKTLYQQHCSECHGQAGEGDNESSVPRIQAQHYKYLLRQFQWIRDGKRRNSSPEMVAQINSFDDQQIHAILDYVSRLEPPEMMQAPTDWKNPDFN